jgi:hypothetical protein
MVGEARGGPLRIIIISNQRSVGRKHGEPLPSGKKHQRGYQQGFEHGIVPLGVAVSGALDGGSIHPAKDISYQRSVIRKRGG